jgi:uncharacterized membrane protein YfcA
MNVASLLPDGLGIASYAMMGVLVLVAACLQGIGGIGFAMFAAPVAGLFFPAMAPAPLLLLGGSVSLLSVLREPLDIVRSVATYGILGRLIGGGLAVAIVELAPLRLVSVAYGLMLLVAVGFTLLGWKVEPTRRNTRLAGVISGVMGTITSAGAPPFAILTQRLEPAQIRATVGVILAVGSVMSLAMLAIAGRFGAQQLALGLCLLPWVGAGFLLSGRLGWRFSATRVRQLLLGLAGLSALAILVKALI